MRQLELEKERDKDSLEHATTVHAEVKKGGHGKRTCVTNVSFPASTGVEGIA